MSSTVPSADAKAVVKAVEGLSAQVRRVADALSTPVVEYAVRADDDATTPATTCSAQHHGHASGPRECIRAGQHYGDHIDEQGYHWSNTVAVYPVHDGPEREAPAADEEACLTHIKGACDGTTRDCVFATPGTARRRSMRVLLNRLNNNLALTADEAQLLTRHVAAVICDANIMRRDNKQLLAEQAACITAEQRADAAERDLRVLRAGLRANGADPTQIQNLWAQIRLRNRQWRDAKRERDQQAAVLGEVLHAFAACAEPGGAVTYEALHPVTKDTYERWLSVLAPTAERPWWEQLDEAQAAIERVRAIKRAPQRSEFNTLANAQDNGWDAALHEVQRALDGAEQPTTEA